MNLDEILRTIQAGDIENAQDQTKKMESENLSVLGPMNMLAFDKE